MLGVMQDDRAVSEPPRQLVGAHRAPQEVQAIGLCRRPGTRIDGEPDAVVTRRHRRDRVDRRAVIGVGADENAIFALAPAIERIAQHRADDARFAPGRDENGDCARQCRRRQVGRRHRPITRIDGDAAPRGPDEEQQVDD